MLHTEKKISLVLIHIIYTDAQVPYCFLERYFDLIFKKEFKPKLVKFDLNK